MLFQFQCSELPTDHHSLENSPSYSLCRSDILHYSCDFDTNWRLVRSSLYRPEADAQSVVLRWMIGHIPNLCEPTNTERFTCNSAKVVYSASLIWGSIGPMRMFQSGQVYSGIMYFFIIGVRGALLDQSYPRATNLYFIAGGHSPSLHALSQISQQLGAVYQRANLLQRRRQHTSSQHKYVTPFNGGSGSCLNISNMPQPNTRFGSSSVSCLTTSSGDAPLIGGNGITVSHYLTHSSVGANSLSPLQISFKPLWTLVPRSQLLSFSFA